MRKYLNRHFLYIQQDTFWFNEYATVLAFKGGYLAKKGNYSKVVRSKKQLKKFLES